MRLAELLERLEYTQSDNYLQKGSVSFNRAVGYGHLYRKAAQNPCRLQGVYALREARSPIPVVYVCDIASEEKASEVHRLVWNQDSVPFLIVNSPDTVRVFPGFSLSDPGGKGIEEIADTLKSTAVDSGVVWRSWGRYVRPDQRVNRSLLKNLQELDRRLQNDGLEQPVSHALIGKYVYLHYLRDRQILSHRKLESFGVSEDAVFGRHATLDALQALCSRLDDWLNGEVFPLEFCKRALNDRRVSRVAATFNGDRPIGEKSWQLHLDFTAYDFSYIPIETLSTIYEQFLHATHGKDPSRGRRAGAYYTPIPVVNLMLSELEERRPLRSGMRVFDPACGSGAFLVQAFRRLIESEFPPDATHPSPKQLRELLENHFFGVDTDSDACNIARFSLTLTLLDYVDLPDLENKENSNGDQRLPSLHRNIFCDNFFNDDAEWHRTLMRKKADWLVGNPPWKKLTKKNARPEDEPVENWIKQEKKLRPVGKKQLARAFAWRAAEYVNQDGEIALFLPAMTLSEIDAKAFRSRFFEKMSVRSLMNFSNLRHVISGGRFEAAAMAVFYQASDQNAEMDVDEDAIRVYSPLAANQETKTNETWSLILNASEIQDVPLADVIDGSALPWKIASWGSHLDMRLIRSVQRRFTTIRDMEIEKIAIVCEGPQLREGDTLRPSRGNEPLPDLIGEPVLNVRALRNLRNFFIFPEASVQQNKKSLIRTRGGKKGLEVCRPPHVLVSAARKFAVYSERFIIVPPRQIGIISQNDDKNLLKALSVFLNSEFAFYHEFFMSPQYGVDFDRSTVESLRGLPTPLMQMDVEDLRSWAKLHDELVKETVSAYKNEGLLKGDQGSNRSCRGSILSPKTMNRMNEFVYDSLGLSVREREVIQDMVRVRLNLDDGKLGEAAVGKPTASELRKYGTSLRDELDDYISGEGIGVHGIEIIHESQSGMISVKLIPHSSERQQVAVLAADAPEAAALEAFRAQIRRQKAQWVYFDRNLRIYDRNRTCIMKPMRKFHWTRTQARLDAMEIISESIARRE